MMLSELPFYYLMDEEFHKDTGVWIYNSINTLIMSRDLFKDIIESPDKVNDSYENLAHDFIESKYFNIKQFGSRLSDIKHKGFSRSKNLTLLNDVLLAVKEMLNIIAITETKLAENSLQNINIPGYKFVGVNSKTSAGGVGFYILDNIDFRTRNDLGLGISQDVEDCWIEIQRSKQNNIRAIYTSENKPRLK